MLKEGVILGERYEIISRIGSGGMADVYKAKDHKLNRMVAVKVLKPEFREDKTFIRKFRTEAQAAAGLSHPNIVNVYDVGEDRGVYYIVMRFSPELLGRVQQSQIFRSPLANGVVMFILVLDLGVLERDAKVIGAKKSLFLFLTYASIANT